MNWTTLTPLRKLSAGYFRLVIVGWVIVTLVGGGILGATTNDEGEVFAGFVASAIAYYILIIAVVWIREGFKNQNKNL